MRRAHLFLAALCVATSLGAPAFAADTGSLFVSLTTSESHRAKMAIDFGAAQMQRGHTVTIFLNDRGVLLASRANRTRFAEHQKALSDAMAKGAVVIICPQCMKRYGVKEAELLSGVQVGKPEMMDDTLFKDGTRTMTW